MALDSDTETVVDLSKGEPAINPNGEDRGDIVTDEPSEGEQIAAEVAAAPAAPTKPATPAAATETEEEEGADAQDARPVRGIPKARFNEVNDERKAALKALEEKDRLIAELLQRGAPAATPAQPAAQAFDEDAMEREYIEAMQANDKDKAFAIRKEINAHLRQEAVAEAEGRISHRQVETDLKEVSAQTLKEHPWLDTTDGAEALELICASRDAKIAKGVSPAKALQQAVAAIAPKFAPTAPASPPVGDELKPKASDTRTPAAVARGAADSLQQPAPIGGTGNRSTAGRVDVSEMDEEQFRSMTPAEKKKARGD